MLGEPWPGVVVVVNDAGFRASVDGRIWDRPVHHWATLHAEKLGGWMAQRKAAGLPDGYQTWSSVKRTVVQNHFNGLTGGSSGLYAVSVALQALKHPRILLCGVPMNLSRNAFSGQDWHSYKRYRKGWEREREWLAPRVRSFSGWTREMFGAPTRQWVSLVPPVGVGYFRNG